MMSINRSLHSRKPFVKRSRSGPIWTFAGDAEELERKRKLLQRLHEEQDREGFGGRVVVSHSDRGFVGGYVSSVVYEQYELESMAKTYLDLVKDLKVALIHKWARSLPRLDDEDVPVDPRGQDVASIRERLSRIHRLHSKRLLQCEGHTGEMLLKIQDLHRCTWYLFLSYLSALTLRNILKIAETFLFFPSPDGRLLELLVKDFTCNDPQQKIQQQVLKKDGSGIIDLVDHLQDACTLRLLNEASVTEDRDSMPRASKRRRTLSGAVSTSSRHGVFMENAQSHPMPIPLSLMMFWIHLVNCEIAAESSQLIVKQEALDKRLCELRNQDRSQFVFDDALRLYMFEQFILYPQYSPLSVEEALSNLFAEK